MTELMLSCYDEPDQVKILLSKATSFIKAYVQAFKVAGADGVFLAEPAAGLLSPALAEEFSTPYVQEIFDAVNDDDFVVCYHNCGNSVADMLDTIATLSADIFHFGNAIDLRKALKEMPRDKVIMGNVDPVLLKTGSVEEVRMEVIRVYQACTQYENFMISTGCDVPAASKWDNIDAYFNAVRELYVQDQM
jgi:uroporphyrinogen decarboxylase